MSATNSLIRKIINTGNAPAAIGPYNQAVKVGKTLYLSGQIGLDPQTSQFSGSDVESQAEQALKNMGKVLEEAGMTFENVVKTTILLVDIWDFAAVNKIYQNYFKPPYPARAAYAVAALPKLAKIEIEGIAVEGPFSNE
ncbi:2-iminobutanoate/2-iminopropanoate deaminase-like [Clavelina lepadiformis]|uniref:Uncharacterized protein n=1 Tax=Clavelina lepadiformis TaxID=159417 RepID=A0ABP0GHD8_CLALP